MEALPLETIGIGGLALSTLWVFWKIFNRMSENHHATLNVVKENAVANEKLATSLDKLTENIKEGSSNTIKNGEALDRFTTIVLELVKHRDNK